MTARETAVSILAAYRREQGFSNILLENALAAETLSPEDRVLVTRLVYGVIERQLTLDFFLAACSAKPLKKLHPFVWDVLRVAAYQLLFLKRIPPSAAVNEAVKAVKKRQPYAAGYVNGVLHQVIRQEEALWSNLPEGDEGAAVRYSCPAELIAFWRQAYGERLTAGLLESANEAPPLYIRVNTIKTTVESFEKALQNAGVSYRAMPDLPGGLEIFSGPAWKTLAKSVKNWYYHQDTASQYACLALGAQPGEKILDVCAAPGGKSLTLAQQMNNRGTVVARDLYEAKCAVMRERADALGVTCLRVECRDAAKELSPDEAGAFDRVWCDVPCSGLGVIRRKPEIRYKPSAERDTLPPLQWQILNASAKAVRPGGVLQYSTCTLNPQENEQVVLRFLKENPNFEPRALSGLPDSARGEPPWYRTLFPAVHGTDGFFVAGFVKKENA